MFVSDNTLKSAKKYFYERLSTQFSSTELKNMWTQIICKRMEWNATELMLQQDARLSESDLLHVRSFVKKLIDQVPFQYLMGETSFYGLTILCDKRALIPRPETEELVQWVIESSGQPTRIMDLCTGSGCIALALKSNYTKADVYALDVSSEALSLCQENADALKLTITTIQDDLLQPSDSFGEGQFDVIASNPPYIPHKEKEVMSAHVLNHEPSLALFVDDADPIIFYKKIAQFAEKKLVDGGFLFFELHESYSQEVCEMLNDFSFHEIEIRKDLQGKLRMLKAQKV